MTAAPESDAPLLEVKGLHRRYGPVHAVRGLDLAIRRGEVVALLGANGAGKSSTLAMLAGVLAPTSGRIRIAGHDLADAPLAAKSRLGYLPDTPPLFPELTVDEYLAHCARLRGVRGDATRIAVAGVRERCGLTGAGGRLLGNLSKGYRQRAGIAQALVHEPDLVILDEPTSGLDPGQLREIRALIRTLGERHAVLLSTHILPEAQSVSDRVQIMHEGRLALEVRSRELDAPRGRHRVRLAAPPPAAALAALPPVREAVAAGDGAFRVVLEPGDAALGAFSAACAGHGWGLLELTAERRSLEDLFVSVVGAADPAPQEPGANAA